MNEENCKALVARYITEVWNAVDPAAALDALTTPDFRYVIGGQPGRDRAGMLAFLTTMRTAFPDWRVRIVEAIADGAAVAIRWDGEVTHGGDFHGIAPTGRRIQVSGINVYHLVGERISAEWEQTDSLGMLRQLGAMSG